MDEYLSFEIAAVTKEADIRQAFKIRHTVFVVEQKVDEEAEIDDHDDHAMHLLATVYGDPIGTLRIRFIDNGDITKVERVAVLKDWRSSGVGAELMKEALAIGARFRSKTMLLHAQVAVIPFYEKLGYEVEGDEFDDEGIPHVAMTRSVPAASNYTFS